MAKAFDRVSRPPEDAVLPFRLGEGHRPKTPALHASPLATGFSHMNDGMLDPTGDPFKLRFRGIGLGLSAPHGTDTAR